MAARHQREGVAVLGVDGIETSVVNTWMKTPSFLAKEDIS